MNTATTAMQPAPGVTALGTIPAGLDQLPGNRGPDAVDAHVRHLETVLTAVTEVSTTVQLLAACRYAPAEVIEAAVSDLAISLRAMNALGPAGGQRSIGEIRAETDHLDDPRIAALLAAIARTTDTIELDSEHLSLELRRLMADLRDVVSIGTGSTGTYDALGRTTLGDHRRRHTVM